jgi:hypothetical protein
MKTTALVLVALVVGFAIGWSIRGTRSTTPPGSQEIANSKELARLYPSGLALRALHDMRVLVLLSSNDVTMARSLLIQDLEIHTSSLSGLSREVQLSEFDRKALKDAESFLAESKR